MIRSFTNEFEEFLDELKEKDFHRRDAETQRDFENKSEPQAVASGLNAKICKCQNSRIGNKTESKK